jgi:hypothetical protein
LFDCAVHPATVVVLGSWTPTRPWTAATIVEGYTAPEGRSGETHTCCGWKGTSTHAPRTLRSATTRTASCDEGEIANRRHGRMDTMTSGTRERRHDRLPWDDR